VLDPDVLDPDVLDLDVLDPDLLDPDVIFEPGGLGDFRRSPPRSGLPGSG